MAVIVLNWNGEALLRRYLPALEAHTPPHLARLIVADNASSDDSAAYVRREHPKVEWLPLDENYGFAGGYNRAIAAVEVPYIVLLNSDVEVAPGWLEPLVAALDENPQVVAVQPKILSWRDKDRFEYAGACGGFIDFLGFPFCRGRVLDTLEADEGQYDAEADIFWATGAAMCVRRENYLAAGGLDEAFFAHMEEIDLCWRWKNQGCGIRVVPVSVVYHLGGGTLPMNHPRKLFFNYRNNLLMLYKNLGKRHWRRIFLLRFLLDMAAAGWFFLKGEWKNSRSVLAAWGAFRKMRREYRPDRSDAAAPQGIYQGVLLWNYYVRGRKYYSALPGE